MQRTAVYQEIVTIAKPWSLIGRHNPSLLEALFPSFRFMEKLMVSMAFVGILVGLSRARFYLPDNPVPITFQTFGVLLIGGVLGWRWGLLSILTYYFLGMAHVPVFQGGNSGWDYVSSSATAGYLIGFILASWVVGYLSQRGWHHGRALWPILLAALLLYLPGLLWLGAKDIVPWENVFSKGMYPFIPGDLIKLMMASLTVGLGWKAADRLQAIREERGTRGTDSEQQP